MTVLRFFAFCNLFIYFFCYWMSRLLNIPIIFISYSWWFFVQSFFYWVFIKITLWYMVISIISKILTLILHFLKRYINIIHYLVNTHYIIYGITSNNIIIFGYTYQALRKNWILKVNTWLTWIDLRVMRHGTQRDMCSQIWSPSVYTLNIMWGMSWKLTYYRLCHTIAE